MALSVLIITFTLSAPAITLPPVTSRSASAGSSCISAAPAALIAVIVCSVSGAPNALIAIGFTNVILLPVSSLSATALTLPDSLTSNTVVTPLAAS